MRLFDSIGGTLKSALEQGGGVALVSAVLEKTDAGGLQGIVSKLETSGFGGQVQSWLGDGQNLPISVDQLKSVLGNEQVQQIAQHFGLPVDGALKLLAEHLPKAVDQASPDGTLQSA